MKKVYIDINVIVIGAGSIGSNFIKEFGRYMAFYNDENSDIHLSIVDNSILNEDDFYTHPILKQDIGWNKASTIADVVIDVFPTLSNKVFSFNLELKKKNELKTVSEKHKVKRYSSSDTIYKSIDYIIDTVGSKSTVKACSKLFDDLENAVLITVNHKTTFGNIDINIKANNKNLGHILPAEKNKSGKYLIPTHLKYISAIACSNILFSIVSNGIGNKNFQMGRINYQAMQHFTMLEENELKEDDIMTLTQKEDIHNVVVCIGTGGTGGAFVKEFTKILLDKNYSTDTSLVLVDGDRVESHNAIRQPFSNEDLMQNKAITLAAAISECYGINDEIISVYPRYIDTVEQLKDAISLGLTLDKKNRVYLVGAVDNHRARQIMHQYFDLVDDIIYIDSANEYSHGEVVISVKEKGTVISPLRSFYFPDLLTDASPSASEQSCGVVNISSPQHYSTNLIAGRIILTSLVKSMHYGIQDTGIIFFDAFRYFSRFQPIIKGVNV